MPVATMPHGITPATITTAAAPSPGPRSCGALPPARRADAGGLLLRQIFRARPRRARRTAATRTSPCRCFRSSRPCWAAWTKRSPSFHSSARRIRLERPRGPGAVRRRPGRAAGNGHAHRGPYDAFAHLETLYLGVLARRTRVGTNTRRVVEAARPKEVMFFPGAPRSLAGADRRRLRGAHRRRHRRLDRCAGLVVGQRGHRHRAARADRGVRRRHRAGHAEFAEHMPADVRLVTLVDFDNDCVGTSLAVARALGDRLYGVRLDTSARHMVDRSVMPQMGRFKPTRRESAAGLERPRARSTPTGFRHVRSSCRAASPWRRSARSRGRACRWTRYGVGSSLFQGRFDFTADIVRSTACRGPSRPALPPQPAARTGELSRMNNR